MIALSSSWTSPHDGTAKLQKSNKKGESSNQVEWHPAMQKPLRPWGEEYKSKASSLKANTPYNLPNLPWPVIPKPQGLTSIL